MDDDSLMSLYCSTRDHCRQLRIDVSAEENGENVIEDKVNVLDMLQAARTREKADINQSGQATAGSSGQAHDSHA